ncbi:MAG: pilus assembly protein PilM [Candidatus Omnitrophota bacterium]
MNPPENKKPETRSHFNIKPKSKSPLSIIGPFFRNLFVGTQNVIGIDIGSSYIKIAQLQHGRQGYVINNCITRPIPQVAKDSPSEKRKLTQEFIKAFIVESRIKTNMARAVISGKGVFIFSLTIPYLSKKDLKGIVAIELKKRLPFQLDMNSVYFDFFVTDQVRDDKGINLQVTCVAVEKLVVEEQLNFLKEINIRPMGINVIPDVLGNLASLCSGAPLTQTVVLMDMGANISMLNFYKGKNLIFSREIPIGGEHLTRAMAKTVTTSYGPVNISVEDAEKLKRTCGIPLEDEAKSEFLTDFGLLLGEQISTTLRPTLERLILEINRTISYYTKTFRSTKVEELYLTGGSSRLKNIDKFLLYNLEGLKKVERLNVLKAVKGWADQSVFKQELVMEQAAPHLSVAFGACFGSGGRINFLPWQERMEQKTIFAANLLRIAFPMVLFLSLAFYGMIYANSLKYKVLISNMDLSVSKLEPTVNLIKEYMQMKQKLEQRKELLDKVKGKQPIWWGVMKELSLITPREVILQKMNILQAKGGRELRLSGKIYAKYTILDVAVSQYIIVLEDSPFFINAELIYSKNDIYSPIPSADFEIVCQLSY